MNTVEQLKAEVNALVTQLRSSNNEAIVKKIHAKEAELKSKGTSKFIFSPTKKIAAPQIKFTLTKNAHCQWMRKR